MGVEGWVGYHGEGKTYCAVAQALRSQARTGVEIWSNADVVGASSFQTWDELMALIEAAKSSQSRAIVLVDEAGKFLSSRFWSKMDPRVLTLLQERRKVGRGLDLWWTAPSWRMIDAQLRDVTQWVHLTRRFGGSEYSHDTGRPPLAFWQRTYRPDSMTTDANQPRAKHRAVSRKLIHFSPTLASMYGTAVLDMSRPMSVELDQRPDYYGESDRTPLPVSAPPPQVVVLSDRGRGHDRGRRGSR